MRAKWLVLILGAMLLVGAASASTVTCASALGTSWATLEAATTGDGTTAGNYCTIGDMVIYGVTDSGTVGAANIQASVVNAPLSLEVGFNITPQLAGSWGVSWNEELCTAANSATLGCSTLASSAETISSLQAQSQGTGTSSGTYTAPVGGSPVAFTTGPGNNANFTSATFGASSVNVSISTAGNLAIANVESFDTVGPEPGTMFLMGGALIGLGAYIRKRRKV